jgi:hypothetical protein
MGQSIMCFVTFFFIISFHAVVSQRNSTHAFGQSNCQQLYPTVGLETILTTPKHTLIRWFVSLFAVAHGHPHQLQAE